MSPKNIMSPINVGPTKINCKKKGKLKKDLSDNSKIIFMRIFHIQVISSLYFPFQERENIVFVITIIIMYTFKIDSQEDK